MINKDNEETRAQVLSTMDRIDGGLMGVRFSLPELDRKCSANFNLRSSPKLDVYRAFVFINVPVLHEDGQERPLAITIDRDGIRFSTGSALAQDFKAALGKDGASETVMAIKQIATANKNRLKSFSQNFKPSLPEA